MKIYIIIANNQETYEEYKEWIVAVYLNKEMAEKRIVKLLEEKPYEEFGNNIEYAISEWEVLE